MKCIPPASLLNIYRGFMNVQMEKTKPIAITKRHMHANEASVLVQSIRVHSTTKRHIVLRKKKKEKLKKKMRKEKKIYKKIAKYFKQLFKFFFFFSFSCSHIFFLLLNKIRFLKYSQIGQRFCPLEHRLKIEIFIFNFAFLHIFCVKMETNYVYFFRILHPYIRKLSYNL